MAYAAVFSVLGWALIGFAGAMLLPAFVGFGYGETALAQTFVAAAGLSVFAGGALVISTRGTVSLVSRREGFLLAVLAWAVLPLFGALPLYFGGAIPAATDAYFEAISALTTTGASVMTNLNGAARSVLFWRALMQWLGGLGTIMLAIALLSLLGLGGMQLYRSAMPRGEQDSLATRLKRSANAIWWIYASLTLVCAILLWLAGLPAFDALCIAFSTLSTGGFTTREGSIAAFDNPLAELVLVAFMLIAAVNFTLHWAAAHGRWRFYREDPELKVLAFTLAGAVVAVAAVLMLVRDDSLLGAGRSGLFMAVSFLTTTGFHGAASGAAWPTFVPLLVIALMIVGGSTGSTAGGLKLMRLSILFKEAGRELDRLSHPHLVRRIRYGQSAVSDEAMRAVWSFFILYVFCLVATMVALAALGLDMRSALVAAAAAFSNTGPAFELASTAGAGYGALSGGAKWVLCVAMLAGRLELFAVVVLLRPALWRR